MTDLLFPALLRYWRTHRGWSQLDLALEAEVSARHVSFLESGRARPSEEMALRLLSTLGVPLRAQNEALRAAGLPPRFPEPSTSELPAPITLALDRMLDKHEPYPMTVLSRDATILRGNRAARAQFSAFVAEPAALPEPLDMYSLLFHPALMKRFVIEWDALARSMLARLHRDHLQTGDERLAARLEQVHSIPGVPRAWRTPDFSVPSAPAQTITLERDGVRLAFLVAVTVFLAPQQVTLEELRLESCFPLDEVTVRHCEAFPGR